MFKNISGSNNDDRQPLLQQSTSSKFYNTNNDVRNPPLPSSSSSSSLASTSLSSINSIYFDNGNKNYSNQSYRLIDHHVNNDDSNNNNDNDRLCHNSASPSGEHGKITWIMAGFLLINAALGAGLLNYPVAYDRLGGIVYATVIQIFAAILMMTTILILIYCAHINDEHSYHDVMKTMCGERIMRISAASITITCFGICVTFIIIIGDQFDRIFSTYVGRNFCYNWFTNRLFTMSITAVAVIWPMCYFRSLDFLRHINVLGVLASFYIIFLNIYSYFYHEMDPFHKYEINTQPRSALEFIAALPVVFFAYQTHEIIIPVYNSMSERSIKSFCKSILLAMSSLLVLYCLAGSFGYLTFGSNVAPDIMLMYNANDPFILAGIVALIVKMITTYPPVVFCGRDTIVRIILQRYQQQRPQQQHGGYQCLSDLQHQQQQPQQQQIDYYERLWNIIITTLWNSTVLLLALIIPNITIAIGFLGSLASCNVFIFPGIALFLLIKRYRKYRCTKPLTSMNSDNNVDHLQQQSLPNGQTATSVQHLDNVNDHHQQQQQQQQQRLKNQWFNIQTNAYIQNFLQLYSLFIIMMGIVMFVIILIQVYDDIQHQSKHGAVCDTLVSTTTSTTSNSSIILNL